MHHLGTPTHPASCVHQHPARVCSARISRSTGMRHAVRRQVVVREPQQTTQQVVSQPASTHSDTKHGNINSGGHSNGQGKLHVGAATQPATPPAAAASHGGQERPFFPALDLKHLGDMLLGDPEAALRDKGPLYGNILAEQDGPAKLFIPPLPHSAPPGAPDTTTLPLLFHLPGLDGVGLDAQQQWPRLVRAFDLRCLLIPRDDRSSFEELADHVAALIKAELDADNQGRPVYLLGQSLGALLALALATKLQPCIDRIVLVNPPSDLAASPWPQLGGWALQAMPQGAYDLLPLALGPLLANPLAVAANGVDGGAPLGQQASELLHGLVDTTLPQLPALRLALPRDTLAWRLRLLQQGCSWLRPRLRDVQQRVLVLGGGADVLGGGGQAAEGLARKLCRARGRVLPYRGHALLMEAGVDLVEILEDQGFYVTQRLLSNGTASRTATDGGGASFGRPVPIPLPTPREAELDSQGSLMATLNRFTSAAFYSTTEDGRVVQGLGGIPQERPLLLIGNHQYAATDMQPMFEAFMKELRVLPRGLAHPLLFSETLRLAGEGGIFDDGRKSEEEREAEALAITGLLSSYGAVPVGGRNMHKLLAQGEIVLMYPGGAREAGKRRGEAYSLMWPERAEFVRMAAKFGATIVPFAAIGADEAVTTHINGDELERLQALLPQLPELPSWFGLGPGGQQQQQRKKLSAAERRALLPAARVGVNATEEDAQAFMNPGVFTFNVPKRTYFIFRRPIRMHPGMAEDRATCHTLYRKVRGEVEGGLGYLLRKREADPWKDLLPRLLYEAATGNRAPAFEP